MNARTLTTPALAAAALSAALAASWTQPARADVSAILDQPEDTYARTEAASVAAQSYMVAAANPVAAEAGRVVLAAGGSAADAAVAIQIMLNLVEPQSSGIGGGAFALYWDASEQHLTTFDGRERAPLTADESYWLKDDGTPMGWMEAVPGGKSVGVPGTLMLLETVHKRHGLQPWAGLIEPTIALADAGFTVSPRLADSVATAEARGLRMFEPTASYFFPGGQALQAGDTLQNPNFAKALRLIADHGAEPFYNGALAAGIADTVRMARINPGMMTLEDLAAYTVVERAPVCAPYRAYEVCGMGPPTSGGLTVGQILGMLSHFDMAAMGPTAEGWSHYIEAAKLAYADRALYMADSDFVDMPQGLLNAGYLADRAALINPSAPAEKAEAGSPPWEEAALRAPDSNEERPGTSHFVIVDRHGDMISMTTTIETGFGSRLMSNGFLLNNELTDFSRVPEKNGAPVANRVEGGKRPRSSMSPTMVLEDGEPMLLIGSPGGSRIINYVAGSLVAILDWGMDPQAAVSMGHVVNRNGVTDLETGTDAEALADGLAALGHGINTRDLNSGLHAILIRDGALIGAADPRREGVAVGE